MPAVKRWRWPALAWGWRPFEPKPALGPRRVDDYLAGLPPAQREVADRLRQIVHAAAPQASEGFKWGRPVYEQNGPLCCFEAHELHVSFGFWRGAQLPSAAGVLDGQGETMAHIELQSLADIQPATLKKLVREAVELNAQRGDPTRRP